MLLALIWVAHIGLDRMLGFELNNRRPNSGIRSLVLEVEDAGHGIGGDAPSGVGIASMRERVQQLNGRFEIASYPDGTTVKAMIPL